MCNENAQKLSVTVDALSANWTIPDLKEDFESLKSRFDMIGETISEVTSALPIMHECYEYQSGLLEVLTWVQELLSILEAEYVVDDVEQITEEIEKHEVNYKDFIRRFPPFLKSRYYPESFAGTSKF